jgi:hypothetical protein
MSTDYELFIKGKTQLSGDFGFEPVFMPSILFPFQVALTEWACKKGIIEPLELRTLP